MGDNTVYFSSRIKTRFSRCSAVQGSAVQGSAVVCAETSPKRKKEKEQGQTRNE